MGADVSNGWDAIAHEFMEMRSDAGADVVAEWAGNLREGGAVLDVGSGHGHPVTVALAGRGFDVYAIDASPTLVAGLRANLPDVTVACEGVETSPLFGRRYDGIVCIGLLFLLDASTQHGVLAKLGKALEPGGSLLASAPRERGDWEDTLTGRRSVSLGEAAYRQALADAGLRLTATHVDRGGNHYYKAVRPED